MDKSEETEKRKTKTRKKRYNKDKSNLKTVQQSSAVKSNHRRLFEDVVDLRSANQLLAFGCHSVARFTNFCVVRTEITANRN